jgi:hypothetical protein
LQKQGGQWASPSHTESGVGCSDHGRRDWSITAGRHWRHGKHVRYPTLAETDNLCMDLGLSVKQRERTGLSRTIDY